ncbi:hypothetical protein DW807_17380 [Clostridium sp. AM32-2]|jgi:hypothetical protein|nr:hypothetical protein [Clostridium sp. AM32-2]RHT19854.1 hypothetical protein DW807_17380 [Clostridium sp. AM32-2]
MRTENKFDEENEEKRELKTLMDYEMLLQEIRLAHVEKDKEKLDQLFTELYAAVMKSEDGYKIQQTPFRFLVWKQYSKISRRFTLMSDSFEDVLQSVMTGIYDGSLFFRRLNSCNAEKKDKVLEKILKVECWHQINDFICNRTGGEVGKYICTDLGIPDERFKVKHDGKVYYKQVQTVSMQKVLDGEAAEGSGENELKSLVNNTLSCNPIDTLFKSENEKSPMEEIAVKLAYIFYDAIMRYSFDDMQRADILLYAHQVQNPVKSGLRIENLETYKSLPAADKFFNQTLKKTKYLGKAIAGLSPEDMKKFSSQLDIILNGIDDYQGKKKLVTACLAYIKDKQEEVA